MMAGDELYDDDVTSGILDEDGCTEACLTHAPDCDGFCDHSADHTNACMEVRR